jgi:hypothetical protein
MERWPGWRIQNGNSCESHRRKMTIWNEIPSEIEGLQYLNLTQDATAIWNDARTREMNRPLTQVEARRVQEGQSQEEIAKERFCRMRPDGIAVLPPMGNKTGVFCILEYKRMSDVWDRYLTRAKLSAENQYASLRNAISDVIQTSSKTQGMISSFFLGID